jgi:hypothetical protein
MATVVRMMNCTQPIMTRINANRLQSPVLAFTPFASFLDNPDPVHSLYLAGVHFLKEVVSELFMI